MSEKGQTPPFPRSEKSPVAGGENSESEGDDAQICAMLSKESPCRKQFLLRRDANGSHNFIGGIKPVFDKAEAQQVVPHLFREFYRNFNRPAASSSRTY